MIYYQCTRVAINRPEKGDFDWYWLEEGIHTDDEKRYSEKKYIWSDEKLENFQYELNIDCFLERVRRGQFEYFKIRKRLFSGREYLVFNGFHTYEIWYLDEIKRMDVKFYYEEQHITLDEAKSRLDVEEYAKMIKSLGLKDYK